MRPNTIGARTSPSTCCTTMTAIRARPAVTGPWATRATSTATPPASADPTTGMNAPRKTSTASGRASGTPSTARAMPISTASTVAMMAVPRR